MREMKDSGVEWIGEIPKDWQVKRIKNLSYVFTGNSIKDSDKELFLDSDNAIPYISTKDIDLNYSVVNYSNGMYVKVDNKFFKVAPKNSILLCIEGGSSGKKIALINRRVAFVNKLCCIESKNIDYLFLYFYIKSPLFENEFRSNISGLIGGVSLNKILNLRIITPIKIDQKNISEYLRKKCSEIDSLSEDIQKQIEILENYKKSVITEAVTKGVNPDVEMKDSGVEWIGEIPKDWEVGKIKYSLKKCNDRNPGNVPVLSLYRELGIVLKDSRDDNHNVTSEDTSNYRLVRINDFVVNKMKAWQGSVAVSNFKGIVSPAYFVYKFINRNFVPKYFHYLLRSCYKDEFMRLSGGIRVGQWDLPSNDLENTFVIIPSITEQKVISGFLDKKCSEIDQTITERQKQLEILSEYKNL